MFLPRHRRACASVKWSGNTKERSDKSVQKRGQRKRKIKEGSINGFTHTKTQSPCPQHSYSPELIFWGLTESYQIEKIKSINLCETSPRYSAPAARRALQQLLVPGAQTVNKFRLGAVLMTLIKPSLKETGSPVKLNTYYTKYFLASILIWTLKFHPESRLQAFLSGSSAGQHCTHRPAPGHDSCSGSDACSQQHATKSPAAHHTPVSSSRAEASVCQGCQVPAHTHRQHPGQRQKMSSCFRLSN